MAHIAHPPERSRKAMDFGSANLDDLGRFFSGQRPPKKTKTTTDPQVLLLLLLLLLLIFTLVVKRGKFLRGGNVSLMNMGKLNACLKQLICFLQTNGSKNVLF